MDLLTVLADLRNQLDIIDQTIAVLEKMSTSRPGLRGRSRMKFDSKSNATGGSTFFHHRKTRSASGT
jgi:hypothetical protein